MSWALAGIALLLAALALREARRAARAALAPPPPPPPPPPPQVDLGPIEAHIDRVACDLADTQGAHRTLEERLAEAERRLDGVTDRLTSIERDVGEIRSTPTPPPPPKPEEAPPPSPEQQVHAHLRDQGWEEIELLPVASPPNAWLVEAMKGGHPAKGRARLHEDGRVEARLGPPTRAFP